MQAEKLIAAEAVMALYLFGAAIFDMKSRKLPVWYLFMGIIPVAVYITSGFLNTGFYVSAPADAAKEVAEALIPNIAGLGIGLIFVLISKAVNERIGMGDAVIFCICGAAAGYGDLMIIIISAFLLGSVYSVAMLATGKLTRKSSFAFVPFIFLGFIMTAVLHATQ